MATNVLDFQTCFVFILLSILSLLCLVVFLYKKPNDSRVDLPPSPPSFPIIGHLHLMLSALPHKSFQKLSSKYGPLLHLRIFNVPVVLVSSASVVHEIFKTHDVNVSSHGHPSVDESLLFGSSSFIVAPYGDPWKSMKKLVVGKLLGPQALKQSRGARASELERLHANLLGKAMKNETVDIAKEAIKLTNNSICKMIMGRSCSEENGEAETTRGLVVESLDLVKKILSLQILPKPLEKLGISLFKKEIMSVSSRFDELLERILVEHEDKTMKDENLGTTDMMDAMLEAYGEENKEYKITRNHIKALSVDLILGGTDVSAQSTQWTMAEIINNPNVLDRLRGEIDSVVGERRLIQETDLPNLPYLQAVVKEGLRLHTSAPILVRKVLKGCNIGGFNIAKNTTLVVNGYAVMRDPDYWEDPDAFKPERFLGSSTRGEEEERREQVLKYIPFGSGRRGCPGTNLAYVFVGTAVGMMVQRFDWRIKGNSNKVSMEEAVVGTNVTMAHPPKFIPIARIPLN